MTACWIWPGAKSSRGYGQIALGKKVFYVHRLIRRLHDGLWHDGDVDHLCGNPSCWNPDHLECVTHAENLRRARVNNSVCYSGHEFTEENTIRDKHGNRRCKICRTASQTAANLRRKARDLR